jgi:hypothetical protein
MSNDDKPFDHVVTAYGVQTEPTVPNPWIEPIPTVPAPFEWPRPYETVAGTKITIQPVNNDDEKLGRIRDIAHEMKGAAESLIAQGKKRVGQLMMKYAAKIIEELEDNE